MREYLVLCMNALDPNELQTATNYLEKRERYFTRYIRQVEALASAFGAEDLQHSKLANLAAQFDPHKAHGKGPANFWHISAELKQDVLSLVGLIQDDDVGDGARNGGALISTSRILVTPIWRLCRAPSQTSPKR